MTWVGFGLGAWLASPLLVLVATVAWVAHENRRHRRELDRQRARFQRRVARFERRTGTLRAPRFERRR